MKVKILFYLLIFMLLASSCSRFQRLRKKGTWKEKYDAAMQYYEKKDYHRSNILFEEILPIIKGTKESEIVNFYYAYTFYHQRQYILSAHHFLTFTQYYARSEYVLEAYFMYGYSKYKNSLPYELDQEDSYEAINAFQTFLNKYPYSEYSQQCNDLIDELQIRLEKKAFQNAKLYSKVRSYKAAMISFKNFQIDFPDSRHKEEAYYLEIQSAFEYAKSSIKSKQLERFQTTIELYEKFVDKYPNSNFIPKAEKIYENTSLHLTNIKKAL